MVDRTKGKVHKRSSKITETKLVIIGAGIAGLGAALKLEQCNFKDYIILEAQSQIGGRICSVPWDDGWLEKGAQYLHGIDSALGDMVEDNDLLGEEVLEAQGLFIRENGSVVRNNCVEKVYAYVQEVLFECEKYSRRLNPYYRNEKFSTLLRQDLDNLFLCRPIKPHHTDIKIELIDWFERFLCIDNACMSVDDLSVEKWGEYKMVEGPETITIKSHYGIIIEKIVQDITKDNIRLNCPVKRIEWSQEQSSKETKSVKITLKNGKKIMANCVIVTCSLGYLKEEHENFFSPRLPLYYVNVIENMGFGLINKVFLDFETPWWEPHTESFQFLWKIHNGRYLRSNLASWTRDLTGFEVIKTHPNVLLGWVGRNGARIVETLTEEQIIEDCTRVLRFILKDQKIPRARRCLRTCWQRNEYVRGAYSHLSKKSESSGGPSILSEPICKKYKTNDGITKRVPVVMLAGEATSTHFFSTTHGAYDTGVKQAEVFLCAYVDENYY